MGSPSIEQLLRAENADLADKYGIIKRRLTENVQTRWCARWAEGNDHGPGHIDRVLANLSALLGADPIGQGRIKAFELFLAATAAVAHDIGIIDGRDFHAERSAELLEILAKTNTFIFDDHSLRVLCAAIVCHSSTTDIDDGCEGFTFTESFVGNEVRPRFVAALVRLSDELDEDRRRAEAWIQDIANVPEASRPYWEFCQRIQGIRIGESSITFDVLFTPEDAGRIVVLGGSAKGRKGAKARKRKEAEVRESFASPTRLVEA